MFIPPANEPLEMSKWRRWVNDREASQEKLNAAFLAFMEKVGKETSSGARQTTVVNNLANRHTRELEGIRGLPAGDATPLVLRTTDDAEPYWSGETIDQAVTYWVSLGTGNSSVEVYAGNSNTAVELPVSFISVDELTMNPIYNPSLDQRPINLNLTVYPSSDLEEFEVWWPAYENEFGNTAPFWTLHLTNASATNRARINIIKSGLVYAGTNVPVLGNEDVWDLDPEFEGAWEIRHTHSGYGANAATPLTIPANSLLTAVTGTVVFDKFYVENVRGRDHMLSFTRDGTLTTGVLQQTYYNDCTSKQYITLARATVGTAPTGADLLVDIQVDGVTEFTTTIAASATTGTATPAAQPWPLNTDVDFFAVDWPVGSYVTVEVTQVGSTVAGADLTVQMWAG